MAEKISGLTLSRQALEALEGIGGGRGGGGGRGSEGSPPIGPPIEPGRPGSGTERIDNLQATKYHEPLKRKKLAAALGDLHELKRLTRRTESEALGKIDYETRLDKMGFEQLKVEFFNVLNYVITEDYKPDWGQTGRLNRIVERMERKRELHSDNVQWSKEYEDIRNWNNYARNFMSFYYTAWEGNIGGGSPNLSKIVSEASEKQINNEMITFFLQDPTIRKSFHNLSTPVSIDAFRHVPENEMEALEGVSYGIKDHTGDYRVKVRGGDFGGAEKLGYLLRWVTGQAFYDEPQPQAESSEVYTPYRLRYLFKYLNGKGWYKDDFLKERKRVTLDDGSSKVVEIKHGIFPFPTMWHASNAMGEFWVDNFSLIGGKGSGEFVIENGIRYEIPAGWKNQARLLSRFSRDIRLGGYSPEQFDLETPATQKRLYIKAMLEFRNLNRSDQALVLRSNLIKTHDVARRNPDGSLRYMKDAWNRDKKDPEGKLIVDYITKPLLDLDERDNEGNLIIDLSQIDMMHFGNANTGSPINNFMTYEGYAFETFKLWEKFAQTDPKAHNKRMEVLMDLLGAEKGYRHLYEKIAQKFEPKKVFDYDDEGNIILVPARDGNGNIVMESANGVQREKMVPKLKTEQFLVQEDIVGNLALREEEINWLYSRYSFMMFMYAWSMRKNGERLPVAETVNNWLKMGWFREYYQQEWRAVGLPNHDWTKTYESPLGTPEKMRKLMGKFGVRRVWVSYLKSALEANNNEGQRKLKNILGLGEGQQIDDQTLIKLLTAFIGCKPAQGADNLGQLEKERQDFQERRRRGMEHTVKYLAFDIDRNEEWWNGRDGYRSCGISDYSEWLAVKDTLSYIFSAKDRPFNLFADYFEPYDERKIREKMVNIYLDREFDPKNKMTGRDWGLKMPKKKREDYKCRLLREESIYTMGELRGKWVMEQVKLDSKGNTYFDDKGVAEIDYLAKTSDYLKPYEVRTKTQFGLNEAIDIPLIPASQLEEAIGGREGGHDFVETLLMGSAGLPEYSHGDAGMEKRLTRLHDFYDPQTYKDFVLAMYADGEFRKEWFENTGEYWEYDRGYLRVISPKKLYKLYEGLRDVVGEDPDWVRDQMRKDGVERLTEVEYKEEQTSYMIPDLEKGKLEKPPEGLKDFEEALGAISATIPGANLAEVQKMRQGLALWRTAKERDAVLKGMAASAALGIPTYIAVSAFGAPPLFVLGGYGFLAVNFIWGAKSRDIDSDGRETAKGLPRIIPWGLTKQRINKRSAEAIIDGWRPVWDDVIPLNDLLKIFIVEPKQKLHRVAIQWQ